MDDEFNVLYKKTFDLRDEHADISLLNQALQIGVQSETFTREIHKQIARIVVDNGDKLDDIMREIDDVPEMTHPALTDENKIAHIQEMIRQGSTDANILELQPELGQEDIDNARGEN